MPIYRCRIGGDQFASSNPGCEGQVGEGLLGYADRRQDVINRAYNPSTGTHLIATGGIAPGYFHEFTLGYALDREGGDRQNFYGCLAGAHDQFLSLDPAARAGASSAARASCTPRRPPAWRPRRCTAACAGHRPLRSLDAACEGQRTEQVLGYLRTDGPSRRPSRCG